MKILDIGCGQDGRSFENFVSPEYCITGVDIEDPGGVKVQHPLFHYYQQDARDLSRFETGSFDLAVSIGMMEHICDRPLLEQMASEMIRVSKQWIVTVPWRYCWIEPHFKFPLFQLLPEPLQIFCVRKFNLHNLRESVERDPKWIREHYQWLPSDEWRRIFKADRVYVLPSLDGIAIVKRD